MFEELKTQSPLRSDPQDVQGREKGSHGGRDAGVNEPLLWPAIRQATPLPLSPSL